MISFEWDTAERTEDCTKAEFPICLSEGILRMFGEKGKKALDSIVMNETFENTRISSPEDIWNIYQKYMERVANILGEDVSKVITFENSKQMGSTCCTKCPVYKREFKRRKSTRKSVPKHKHE